MLELARQRPDADYERLVFSYSEKAPVGTSLEQLEDGIKDDVSVWGDFYYYKSDEPIPAITDLTGEVDESKLLVEQ